MVIDRLVRFYEHENSNVHRAAHTLAARSTGAYEAAREVVRRFLHASSADEIVFVRGATEALNLVAQTWGRRHVGRDDEIVISWLEHHSNIVPWQQLAAESGARLRVVPVDDRGQLTADAFAEYLTPRTKLVALTHVSNALGTVTPIAEIIRLAHGVGALVVVDGAQAVSHMSVDVQQLDADFYAFSGHKVFGPTGIGVLYGKTEALAQCPPWQTGGHMVADVTFARTAYHGAPLRFEAGTGDIAGAIGLAAALEYLLAVGLAEVAQHEQSLLAYCSSRLDAVPQVRQLGTGALRAGVISFVVEGTEPQIVAAALDRAGIAVRAGHHCAQPALRRFGVESTVRASLALYNTPEEIDRLAAVLGELVAMHASEDRT